LKKDPQKIPLRIRDFGRKKFFLGFVALNSC